MSADDDNQADQQRELADPGKAETDYSVPETPWQQLCSRPVVVNAASEGLQGRQWCGCSIETGTTNSVEHRLEMSLKWSFQSRVAIGSATLLVDENGHQWHGEEDGAADEERQNNARQFSERAYVARTKIIVNENARS